QHLGKLSLDGFKDRIFPADYEARFIISRKRRRHNLWQRQHGNSPVLSWLAFAPQRLRAERIPGQSVLLVPRGLYTRFAHASAVRWQEGVRRGGLRGRQNVRRDLRQPSSERRCCRIPG